MFDVIVVGAGPAGCRCAELIAKQNYKVLVIEEHSSIGKPVQCAGLVSEKIGKLEKNIVINKIKRARFYCDSEFFEIKNKKDVYVIDRGKFDKSVAEKAKKSGVKFKLATKFLDFKNSEVITNKGIYKTKILIGADGPNSSVAKKIGLNLPRNLLLASQVKVKGKFEKNRVELWLGKVAPGFFVWVVPENSKVARVGLMTNKNPDLYLEKFLEKRFGKVKVSDKVNDFIRYGLIKKSVKNNVLLVGDAACQVKPFSAGGLVYGRICAEYAADACLKSLKKENFSEEFFVKEYDEKWKKELRKAIKKGLFFKRVFLRIGNKEFIFRLIRNFRITEFSNFLDMDFLGKK